MIDFIDWAGRESLFLAFPGDRSIRMLLKKKHSALNCQLPSFGGWRARRALFLKNSTLSFRVKTVRTFFRCNRFCLFCFALSSLLSLPDNYNTCDIFYRNPLLRSFMWIWIDKRYFVHWGFEISCNYPAFQNVPSFWSNPPFPWPKPQQYFISWFILVGGRLRRMCLSIICFSSFRL